MRVKGKIKWFNEQKGYGFILGDDGEDYFVHFSQAPRNARLDEGLEVSFEPHEGDRGKQAKSVDIE